MIDKRRCQELLETEIVFEQIRESEHVLIWGATYNTEEVLRFYKDVFEGKHLQIVDKNKVGKYICGYEVKAPDVIDYEKIDLAVIMSANYHDEIAYALKNEYGYKGARIGLYVFRQSLQKLDSYDECICHFEDFIKHMEDGKQSYSYDFIYKERYSKYKKIKLFAFWASSIGESIRFLVAYYDGAFKHKKENEYYLLVPFINGNDFANGYLIEIISRTMPMVTYENCHFWRYVLKKHPEHFDLEYYNDYNGILADPFDPFDKNAPKGIFKDVKFPFITYTEEEKTKIEDELAKMGIFDEEYVCVFARDSTYWQHQWERVYSFVNIRDMDIESFRQAIEYLAVQNIKSVRMGKVVNQPVAFSNCIDYALKYHSDLMDLYLLGKCKFYAGSLSGIAELSSLQGVPMVLLGVVQIGVYNSIPYRSSDIYVPKKVYDNKNKRLLNFTEMWDAEMAAKVNAERYYAEYDLEFIELDEEEVREAVIEMNEKIDGNFLEDKYDRELQQKYHSLLDGWIKKNGYQQYFFLNINISSSFIRKNAFLLEERNVS